MKTHVNLLPWQFRYGMLRRTRLRQWSWVWGASLLVAAGLWHWKTVRLNEQRHALQLRQRIAKPVQLMTLETSRFQARLAELGGRQSLLRELQAEKVPFRIMGVVSRSARHCSGRVAVRHLELSRKEAPPPSQGIPVNAAAADDVLLVLDGVAADNLAISEFVMQLRGTGVFERVELKSTLTAQGPDGATRSYKIVCNL
jgi:Tfp pilus assembly protein PilN